MSVGNGKDFFTNLPEVSKIIGELNNFATGEEKRDKT